MAQEKCAEIPIKAYLAQPRVAFEG